MSLEFDLQKHIKIQKLFKVRDDLKVGNQIPPHLYKEAIKITNEILNLLVKKESNHETSN